MTTTDVSSPAPAVDGGARRSKGLWSLQTLEAAALPLLTVALIVLFTLLPATHDTFPRWATCASPW